MQYDSSAADRIVATNPELARVQKLLDRPIGKIFKEFTPDLDVVRAENVLLREGLHTIRHILIAGRKAVDKARGFGGKKMDALESVIRAIDPALAWHEKPTMADIAVFCHKLNDLPAPLLMNRRPEVGAKALRIY